MFLGIDLISCLFVKYPDGIMSQCKLVVLLEGIAMQEMIFDLAYIILLIFAEVGNM